MILRRAEQRDIPQIGNLLIQVNEVHHNGRPDLFRGHARKYTDAELQDIFTDMSRPALVAEDGNGTVLGYAFCILEDHTGSSNMMDIKTLYIDDLCVDEKRRGEHIGSELYRYALETAKELGCYNVTLNVWSCNPSAMKFYEAQGLKPLKVGMEHILQ